MLPEVPTQAVTEAHLPVVLVQKQRGSQAHPGTNEFSSRHAPAAMEDHFNQLVKAVVWRSMWRWETAVIPSLTVRAGGHGRHFSSTKWPDIKLNRLDIAHSTASHP